MALRLVREGRHGAEGVFGGSYGWSSAGRFHHAQSQIHRFLNIALGGYVRSVNSYSAGASAVILPWILGPFEAMSRNNVTWSQIEAETDVVLAFGGMALKNSNVASGGVTTHIERGAMARAAARGCRFHLFSPLRDDFPPEAGAIWHPIRPGTDVAVMLGLCNTMLAEGLHDVEFLEQYCTGFDVFSAYLAGGEDGQPKTAEWASGISGVPAQSIVRLAREMTAGRSLVTVAHALQRARFGEQPVWAGAALAAMAGQIGLPGGGYNYALGTMGHTGRRINAVPIPTLLQGRNGVSNFIPVARISDMLLNPGETYHYDGREMTYPDIRLVYWAGGNPFHHQDLNRLRSALARPQTIIVLPATMTLEREDIGAAGTDPRLIAMRRLAPAVGMSRDDYAIFADLSRLMGSEDAFTEGRDAREWLAHLYEPTRMALAERGWDAPDFESFWERGELTLPSAPDDGGMLRAFRQNPQSAHLPTPSGRIEIFSRTIADFGYDDCPGHPVWLAPDEVPNEAAPLVLIANQPSTRLHSQLDFGAYSQSSKVRGREPARLNPQDAAQQGIRDGDIVRIFNGRGACLAGAVLRDGVMAGIVNLSTGAWFDPLDVGDGSLGCGHGNPNILTRDIGTSKLAQGCCGQVTVVEVSRYDGELPPVRAYDPPSTELATVRTA
ncbi:Trimethylamine-N-oxide reductase (Cytochrome c) [Pseudorhizobium banfieldiae]|uniref:Trimethylamine-N-oxide reductase (Cytochrome c) n=1 Tax=Pseudorhizobium banfieldiae TaxID=1125847 RepID=L0NB60_9HYPH|nr:molybdopterin dinucleotide binding domain-containing protein [Pseudorhizobium banfieldiae]CAD6601814.1 aspartyl/glutamyl-tRNA(Asn/Gln) amidotransferase subunit C [arsenite-oxidising bacterium NT-25]CCF18290.1 Trimethylamine-N-oxide reductase (Cytochrome c) [Pseudorhizobium banfieldiae]